MTIFSWTNSNPSIHEADTAYLAFLNKIEVGSIIFMQVFDVSMYCIIDSINTTNVIVKILYCCPPQNSTFDSYTYESGYIWSLCGFAGIHYIEIL